MSEDDDEEDTRKDPESDNELLFRSMIRGLTSSCWCKVVFKDCDLMKAPPLLGFGSRMVEELLGLVGKRGRALGSWDDDGLMRTASSTLRFGDRRGALRLVARLEPFLDALDLPYVLRGFCDSEDQAVANVSVGSYSSGSSPSSSTALLL